MRNRIGGFIAVVVAMAAGHASAALMVPAYSSAPTFRVKVYLDFDGDVTANYGNYQPGTTPAYSIDADTSDFSAQELDNIHKIWMGVAEKYSPFKVDVTTIDPQRESGATRVVIGGDGSWAPPNSGGIAIEGSFANTGPNFPNLAFVFPGHLGNGNPRYVAEASAHEVGHGFGLAHQALYNGTGLVNEYNPGDAYRAPIMGKSYFAVRGQWWYGPTPDTLAPQDDMKIIAATGPLTNGFGYRPDDHPDDPLAAGDALLMAPDMSISGQGIIEKTSDIDLFSFVSPGGAASITADVAPFAPMLDLSLGLYDDNGNLILSSATGSLGESLSTVLIPGTYKLAVSSAGTYGDVGQYFISGFIPEPSCGILLAWTLASLLSRRRARRIA